MACSCSRYKGYIINNLLTSNVRSLIYGKILNLDLAVSTSPSLGQYGKVSVWDFPVMTSLSVNK